MRRLSLLALALCLLAAPARAGEPPLPEHAGLEPAVRFWTRVYTEVGSRGGLLHDAENLAVVYEALRLPEGLSRRAHERRVDKARKRISTALRQLATGRRDGLSAEEARVLARWPEGTSNATLGRAANRVRYQAGQADRFREGLIRSGHWSAFIEATLAEHGVPRQLVALPHVESSFNPRSYSRVGAAGLWQFTRSTGRLYLRVDNVLDERMDPHLATVAAARLLRDNQRRLKSWPLAITAYNHGVAGMARAARQHGSDDIVEIVRSYRGRTFGFASRNFYAEFLAASRVHRDHERYFGPLRMEPPLDYARVETDAYYAVPSLTRALGLDAELLQEHNLALRPAVWTGAKLVPRGYALQVPRGALAAEPSAVLASIPDAERLAQQHRDRFHKVRRGETLSRIARRYGVGERELVYLNNLRSRHRIRVGQVLRLPDDGKPVVVARSTAPADGLYRVRRGDNLTVIAQRFGVGQTDLVRWNRLPNRNQLSVGQRLRVAPEAASAAPPVVLASATPVEFPAAPPPAAEPEPEPEPEALPEAAASAAPPEPADAELPLAAVNHEPVAVPDPSNYAVDAGDRITVQAEETLGHYAEWLELPASRLRRLNRMKLGTPLVIGRQKKLDFSRVTPEVFEQRRLAFHRSIQEEFFENYSVSGTLTHTLRRGQTLWYVARERYEVPIWLLRQYNPDLDFGNLRAGTPMVIPVVEAREEAG